VSPTYISGAMSPRSTESRVGHGDPWRQALKATLAWALGRRRLLVAGPAGTDECCLTFDDGPHPEHTGPLLDVLRSEGIAATFFVIGREAERHPELVRRMVAEGHAVGHHSWSHGEPARTPPRELAAEVDRTRRLLAEIAGVDSRLFRPPRGKLDAPKLWRLLRAGQTVVLWNLDPGDYGAMRAEEVAEWLARRPLAAGDLVLLHDDRPIAAAVLPRVVREARSRGLRFGLVSGWAA
jgi:peptidoglycan-N-acetylglucosamine deacetylase